MNYVLDDDDRYFWNEVCKEAYRQQIMNTIKDDDNMIYKFPANDVIFDIQRTANHFFVDGGPNYRVTITANAIYGNKLFDIITDEVNVARIVDNLEYFNFSLGGYGDTMSIELTPSDNSSFEYTYIYLERTRDIEDIDVYDDPFNILFEIRKYSKIHQQLVTMYTTKLNTESLDNLAYALFFVSLIDLDPDDYRNALNTDVTDDFIDRLVDIRYDCSNGVIDRIFDTSNNTVRTFTYKHNNIE